MYRVVSIEAFDDEHVVYTATNPNWKTGVFRGTLDECNQIASAYMAVDFQPVGPLALECYHTFEG